MLISIAAAVTWLSANLIWPASYSYVAIPYWNALMRFGIFLIVVYLLSSLRTLYDDLEGKVRKRTAALTAEIEERKRLLQQLEENNEELSALAEVTRNDISTLDLGQLLNVLLSRLLVVMRADTAVILLKEGDHLRARASIGVEEAVRTAYSVPIGKGFAGSIVSHSRIRYSVSLPGTRFDADCCERYSGWGYCATTPTRTPYSSVSYGLVTIDW